LVDKFTAVPVEGNKKCMHSIDRKIASRETISQKGANFNTGCRERDVKTRTSMKRLTVLIGSGGSFHVYSEGKKANKSKVVPGYGMKK
jgi:hypothetical protein